MKNGYEATPREPVSEQGKQVSEEEYWKTYYYGSSRFRYEWNNGYLEEIPDITYAAMKVGMWFDGILYDFNDKRREIQIVTRRSIGFRLPLLDKVTIRKPVSAAISVENPLRLKGSDSVYSGIFDMCIEIVSDISDKTVEQVTVVRKEEYEAAGVREYYVLDAEEKHLAFYRLGSRGKYEHINPDRNDIIRSDVLPGFQFRVSDLYRQPKMMEMGGDEAYPYIMRIHYEVLKQKLMNAAEAVQEAEDSEQTEKKRARKAEKLAASEKRRANKAEKLLKKENQRADKAEDQVEKLKAKLREAGIKVE